MAEIVQCAKATEERTLRIGTYRQTDWEHFWTNQAALDQIRNEWRETSKKGNAALGSLGGSHTSKEEEGGHYEGSADQEGAFPHRKEAAFYGDRPMGKMDKNSTRGQGFMGVACC